MADPLAVKSINIEEKTVTLTNETELTVKKFKEAFYGFWRNRIAGETLVPADVEHFMRRTSGKALKQLMLGMKSEGYMEGQLGMRLTKGQKVGLITIAVFIVIIFVGLIMLQGGGVLPW